MIVLPFEAEANGMFNGDMFADWYDKKPTDPKELHFWTFLHNWEKSVLIGANIRIFELIKKQIEEQL